MGLPNASNTGLACMIWSSTEPWKQQHSNAHYLSLGVWGFAPRGSKTGKVLDNFSVSSPACTRFPTDRKGPEIKRTVWLHGVHDFAGSSKSETETRVLSLRDQHRLVLALCDDRTWKGANRVSVREESNCCWFPSVSTVNNTDSCPDATKPFSTPLTNHHTAHWLHTSSNCRLKTYNCVTTGHLHASALSGMEKRWGGT